MLMLWWAESYQLLIFLQCKKRQVGVVELKVFIRSDQDGHGQK